MARDVFIVSSSFGELSTVGATNGAARKRIGSANPARYQHGAYRRSRHHPLLVDVILTHMNVNALRFLILACGLWVMSAATSAATPTPVAQEAVWTVHDLTVHLNHLPKAYSCDDLWNKFHDVLLAIGARPDLTIVTFRCGPRLAQLAYSPEVRLHFSIPQPVSPTPDGWADVNVKPQTVRLEPGHPASLDATDCELLRQMKSSLLAALPNRIVGFRLACDAPPTRWRFNVSLETVKPSGRPLEEDNRRLAARD
jgi:hypothetical protein